MTFDPTEKSRGVKGHTQYVVRAEEGEPGNEARCGSARLYTVGLELFGAQHTLGNIVASNNIA